MLNEKLINLPDSAYDEYLKELKTYSDTAKTKLRSELSRAKVTKAGYEKKITDLSSGLASIKNEQARKVITEQIGEASQFIQEQEQLIQKSQKSLERSTLPAIDKDEFKSNLKEMVKK